MSRLRLVGTVLIMAVAVLGLAQGGVCFMPTGCHGMQAVSNRDCCTPSNVPDGWNKIPCRPQQMDRVYLQSQPEKVSPQIVQLGVTTPVVTPILESTSRPEIDSVSLLVPVPRFLLACNLRL